MLMLTLMLVFWLMLMLMLVLIPMRMLMLHEEPALDSARTVEYCQSSVTRIQQYQVPRQGQSIRSTSTRHYDGTPINSVDILAAAQSLTLGVRLFW